MTGNKKRPWKIFSWPRVGVVDVGSNAIRATVADVESKEIHELGSYRFALRLGKDVFDKGVLTSKSQDALLAIFLEIREIFVQNNVEFYRVVATSALRSARNRKIILSRVFQKTGIEIELINAIDEGRLIGSSMPRERFATKEFLMDLGGGSLEMAYFENGVLGGVTSLPLGAVRLLRVFQNQKIDANELCRHIANVCSKNVFLNQFLKSRPKKFHVVGSGGNIRALYRLRKKILHKEPTRDQVLNTKDLSLIIKKLESASNSQRVALYNMAKDRADIILPAAYVFYELLHYLGVDEVHVPMSVSLRRGMLVDFQSRMFDD